MQECSLGRGQRHQLPVYLEGPEYCVAIGGFALLSHARPDVGVNRIGSGHGRANVIGDFDDRPGALRHFLCRLDDGFAGLESGRGGNGDAAAQGRGGKHQRVRHVVAVAHESQLQRRHIAEALLEREVIGQGLARVLQLAEPVDDGHGRVLRHVGDGRMLKGTQHDAVDPALQVVGDVGDLLARVNAAGVLHEHGGAAQLADADLEGHAGAQRRLLEHEHELLAGQGAAEPCGSRLDPARHVEDLVDLGGRQVGDGYHVGLLERAARRNAGFERWLRCDHGRLLR